MAARKTSRAASKDVKRAMSKRKRGTLKSGSGRKVTSRKQAVAIGLSEARKKGKKVAKKEVTTAEVLPVLRRVAAARGGAKDFTTPRDMRAEVAMVR